MHSERRESSAAAFMASGSKSPRKIFVLRKISARSAPALRDPLADLGLAWEPSIFQVPKHSRGTLLPWNSIVSFV